jgi:hypothetical protein
MISQCLIRALVSDRSEPFAVTIHLVPAVRSPSVTPQ